jgi:hypothetical protein
MSFKVQPKKLVWIINADRAPTACSATVPGCAILQTAIARGSKGTYAGCLQSVGQARTLDLLSRLEQMLSVFQSCP